MFSTAAFSDQVLAHPSLITMNLQVGFRCVWGFVFRDLGLRASGFWGFGPKQYRGSPHEYQYYS